MNRSVQELICESRKKILITADRLNLVALGELRFSQSVYSTQRVLNWQYADMDKEWCQILINGLNGRLRAGCLEYEFRDKKILSLLLEIGKLCFYLTLESKNVSEIPDLEYAKKEMKGVGTLPYLIPNSDSIFMILLDHLYSQFNYQEECLMTLEMINSTGFVIAIATANEIVRVWDQLNHDMKELLRDYLEGIMNTIDNVSLSSVSHNPYLSSCTKKIVDEIVDEKENAVNALNSIIIEFDNTKGGDKMTTDDVFLSESIHEVINLLIEIPFVQRTFPNCNIPSNSLNPLARFINPKDSDVNIIEDKKQLLSFAEKLYFNIPFGDDNSEEIKDCMEVFELSGILIVLCHMKACGVAHISKSFWKAGTDSEVYRVFSEIAKMTFINAINDHEASNYSICTGILNMYLLLAEIRCRISLKELERVNINPDDKSILTLVETMPFKKRCVIKRRDLLTGIPVLAEIDIRISISNFLKYMESVRHKRQAYFDMFHNSKTEEEADKCITSFMSFEKHWRGFTESWVVHNSCVLMDTNCKFVGADFDGDFIDKNAIAQLKEINKEEEKMENVTKNIFDGMMQKVNGMAMTMDGSIAVKNGNDYKSYDQKKGCLVNVTGLTIPGSDGMFFTIPSTKVNVGDLIFVNEEKPVFVTEISNQPKRITVVNYATNEVTTVVPETYMFMGNTYFFKKIICPFGNMFGKGNNGMMKMLMFQSMVNNQNQDAMIPMSSSGPNMMNLGSLMNLMIMKSCFGGNTDFDFFDFDDDGIDFSEDPESTDKDETALDNEQLG